MEFIFKVTEQEANIIIGALAEQPAKLTMNLIGKLQLQAKEQQTKSVEPEVVK